MKILKSLAKINPIIWYLSIYTIVLLILCYFRDAVADESEYLREAMIISELFKKGIWIGDYGVGLHGFLFKIPAALGFIVLGYPSVFLATFFTIALSVFSLYLFYKIVRRFFSRGQIAFWATVLLSVALHYVNTTLSFNRDIPAVFTVLLFTYLFLKNSNRWWIGVSLLLMLDAKEHVFLTVAPFYGLFLIINTIKSIKKENIFRILKVFFLDCFAGYILPVIWIILMLTTSLIPINMFVASIFGFTKMEMDWNKSQFSTTVASQNLMDEDGVQIPLLEESPIIISVVSCASDSNSTTQAANTTVVVDNKIVCGGKDIVCFFIKGVDFILLYVGKILYPRTFSFISIPKLIVLPAIMMALMLFFDWWKKGDKRYIFPMILIFNVFIIIIRASHGRYLLGVAPFFMIFFAYFVFEGIKNPKFFFKTLLLTTIFTILGFFFESTFIYLKILLNLSLLAPFWLIWLIKYKKFNLLKYAQMLFLAALSLGMFLTAIAYSYKIGQISSFMKFGYDRETEIISKSFEPDEIIWINNYGSDHLLNTLRLDMNYDAQWMWELQDWVPKKKLLKIYSKGNTYSFPFKDLQSFKDGLLKMGIEKVVLVESTIDKFKDQDSLLMLQKQDWLELQKVENMQNKKMYIFNVKQI